MSTADKQISVAVALVVLIHGAVLIMASVSSSFTSMAYLNLTVSASLLLHWTQKQIRIQQHVIELREIVALAFEVGVAGCSAYALVAAPVSWLRVALVFISGFHFLAALLFFILMLTFKMRKLF
jgi:hypothetical protein